MVIAGDELHTAKTTGFQTLQEVTPVYFVLAHGHGNAQDLPFSVLVDAQRGQNSQIAHLSILPHLLIVSIQEQVRVFFQMAVAPLLQVYSQDGSSMADLSR